MAILINSFKVGIPYDSDAQAFLTAGSITDSTVSDAINNYVIALKGFSLWTKLISLWPFAGGTALAHSKNLKNPSTLAVTFMDNGFSWTHSATGAQKNTNAYAKMAVIPATHFTADSYSIGVYSRTGTAGSGVDDFSAFFSFPEGYRLSVREAILSNNVYCDGISSSARIQGTSDGTGLFSHTRRASNDAELYVDGASVATTAVAGSAISGGTVEFYMGAANNAGSPSQIGPTREFAMAFTGLGLTDSEMANLYTATQAFQTALSRNV